MYNPNPNIHSYIIIHRLNFVQIYTQNADLKDEVAQMKLSKKNATDELERLKDNSLIEQSNFFSEAEVLLDQMEEILNETKANFAKLPVRTYVPLYYLAS